ncbi:MAG: GtrA family protein [Motilibacteraceae bacterium]
MPVLRRLLAMAGELARFGSVGLVALVVDIGVFNLARFVAGLGPLTSKTLSVLLATAVAYAGNRWWTYRHHVRQGLVREGVLFLVLNVAGLLITLACLAFSHYVLGLTGPVADNVSANVVGLGLGTAFRFWSYRRFVFRVHAGPAAAAADEPVQEAAEVDLRGDRVGSEATT